MSVPTSTQSSFSRSKFEELMKRKFFYAPSFSIYGGVAGLYDYGPPGCAVQTNVMDLWRRHFILAEQMLEVDCSIMTPYKVLETSGHVARFSDYIVKDVKTGDCFRADHLVEAFFERVLDDPASPADKQSQAVTVLAQIDGLDGEALQNLITEHQMKSDLGNELTPVAKFNLMFGTDIGPTGYLKGFLRPETAQGQFVNFKRLLECNNQRMPFASAMIGKSFRNEISPRSGLLRVREFLMAEIEHYVHPDRKSHPKFASVSTYKLTLLPASKQLSGSSETVQMEVGEAVSKGVINNETLGYFLVRVALFLQAIGIKEDRLRFRQHMPNEMAHYASDCWDAEIRNSYGWIECVGCADRAAYDLSVHTKATKEKLVVVERLETPIIETVYKPLINRMEIGVGYRQQAKQIISYLEDLDQQELSCIFEKHFIGEPKEFSFTASDGNQYTLKQTMFSVEKVEQSTKSREYTPNVIEPSFGVGRIIYSLLEHSFWCRPEDETRQVLSLPPWIAPLKVVLLPLSNNQVFNPFLREISDSFSSLQVAFNIDDSSVTIGKRYARNDELGIPFFVTIDFQTVQDRTVTVRERDTTEQIRVPISKVASLVHQMSLGTMTWKQAQSEFPTFIEQELENVAI